jgi:hypothetical protein
MRGKDKSTELLPHKSIITQVEKKHNLIIAASVSAYSDSVSAYSDRDCFSIYIYIFFRFVFSENFLEIFILQIYNKKKKVGQ